MILVAIPAFNEQDRIGKVVEGAKRYCDEVVVCDDGSTDLTVHEAESAGARVIRGSHQGYGGALARLFDYADRNYAERMVTMDGDGQHDPEDIPRLLRVKADLVIGSRSEMPDGYRGAGVRAINAAANAGVADSQSGFRAYSKTAIYMLKPTETGMSASTEILTKARANRLTISEVPITVRYDEDSHTHNALYQGLDVMAGTVKQKLILHPLIYLAVPGLVLFASMWGFFAAVLWLYGVQGHVAVSIELVAIAVGLSGEMLMLIGAVLWVLISVVRQR